MSGLAPEIRGPQWRICNMVESAARQQCSVDGCEIDERWDQRACRSRFDGQKPARMQPARAGDRGRQRKRLCPCRLLSRARCRLGNFLCALDGQWIDISLACPNRVWPEPLASERGIAREQSDRCIRGSKRSRANRRRVTLANDGSPVRGANVCVVGQWPGGATGHSAVARFHSPVVERVLGGPGGECNTVGVRVRPLALTNHSHCAAVPDAWFRSERGVRNQLQAE